MKYGSSHTYKMTSAQSRLCNLRPLGYLTLSITLCALLTGCATTQTYSARDLYPSISLPIADTAVSATISGFSIGTTSGGVFPSFSKEIVIDFYLEADGKHVYLYTQDSADHSYHMCRYSVDPSQPLTFIVYGNGVLSYANRETFSDNLLTPVTDKCRHITWISLTDGPAQKFADSLYTIISAPSDSFGAARALEKDTYSQWAATYHDINAAGALPSALAHVDTLTQAAFQSHNNEQAISGYFFEVYIAPYWAQAHYNLALLLADEKDFPGAIREMSRYLLLLPDAPDAQKVLKQVWVWQSEIQREFVIDSE